jgi:hypothetical protein
MDNVKYGYIHWPLILSLKVKFSVGRVESDVYCHDLEVYCMTYKTGFGLD